MMGARSHRGFTLVEVLVALLMMALLAALAWQAMDGVLRARDDSRVSIDRSTRLATILSQWEQDLQAVIDTEAVPALAFDGQTLRLTRRSDAGVALVAWSVRNGRWLRWTVPAFVRAGELQEAWLRSQQLQGTEPGHVTLTAGAETWQVYFARDGIWTNAQSSANQVQVGGPAAVPPSTPANPTSNPAQPGTVRAGEGEAGAGTPSTPASPSTPGTPAAPATPASAAPSQVPTLRDALPEAVRLVITLDGKTLTRDISLGPAGT